MQDDQARDYSQPKGRTFQSLTMIPHSDGFGPAQEVSVPGASRIVPQIEKNKVIKLKINKSAA
jgi:hypothetical protein